MGEGRSERWEGNMYENVLLLYYLSLKGCVKMSSVVLSSFNTLFILYSLLLSELISEEQRGVEQTIDSKIFELFL